MQIRVLACLGGERVVVRGLCCAALVIGAVLLERRAEGGDAAPTGGGAAMRIYRDPDTGAVGAPAPNAVSEDAARAAAPAPVAAPLVVESVDASAGGIKIDLRGRFQAAVTRHVAGSQPGPHECVESGTAAHE